MYVYNHQYVITVIVMVTTTSIMMAIPFIMMTAMTLTVRFEHIQVICSLPYAAMMEHMESYTSHI